MVLSLIRKPAVFIFIAGLVVVLVRTHNLSVPTDAIKNRDIPGIVSKRQKFENTDLPVDILKRLPDYVGNPGKWEGKPLEDVLKESQKFKDNGALPSKDWEETKSGNGTKIKVPADIAGKNWIQIRIMPGYRRWADSTLSEEHFGPYIIVEGKVFGKGRFSTRIKLKNNPALKEGKK